MQFILQKVYKYRAYVNFSITYREFTPLLLAGHLKASNFINIYQRVYRRAKIHAPAEF